MSPCYKVLVKSILETNIIFQVHFFDLSQGFDFENPANILRLLAFGVHFYEPDGKYRKFNFPVIHNEISHKQLYDHSWLTENASNYYRSAICKNEESYLEFLYSKQLSFDLYKNIPTKNTDYQTERSFFSHPASPHCIVEVKVTNKEYLQHLSEEML